MTIQEWGEENFIEYLASLFSSQFSGMGIGDDCAVIPYDHENVWLVTTDAIIEGIHFIKEQVEPEDLGYKVVAVNVSDIVAMGGKPKYAFLVVALPNYIDCEWLKRLVNGLKKGCDQFEILLLGGDTNGSKRDLFLNMTLIGQAQQKYLKFRHLAKPGDVICVSSFLGDSAAGLRALQQCLQKSPTVDYLIGSHFRPQPSVDEGLWLAYHEQVHAMIDLSDGLDRDLRRILKASKCGAIIEIAHLPISEALRTVSHDNKWDVEELAIGGGEDYCLLATISANEFNKIQKSFYQKFTHPLYAVGYITYQPREILYHYHGQIIPLSPLSFNHFGRQ